MPRRDESTHSFYDVIAALLVAVGAAVAAFGMIVLVSIPIGELLWRMRVITDEGAAWFAMSIGIPVGIVAAIVCFAYAMRFKLNKSRNC